MKRFKNVLVAITLIAAILVPSARVLAIEYGTVAVASSNAAGQEANAPASSKALSIDGRYLLFSSGASNLVDGDFNNVNDIFRKDLITGEVIRVSLSDTENEANGDSSLPTISGDGRYALFRSVATNLIPGSPQAGERLYLRDLTDGTTKLVSVDQAGNPQSLYGSKISLSDDGNLVVYSASAQIYLRNIADGTTKLISKNSSNSPGNNISYMPHISGDGRFIVYASRAKDLVANNSPNHMDIYLYTINADTTDLITPATNNNPPGPSFGESTNPYITTDGSYVTFVSTSQNLQADQTMGQGVYVRTMATNTTRLASVGNNGLTLQGFTDYVDTYVTDDGQKSVFQFRQENWQTIPQNSWEIYLRDQLQGATSVVSYAHNGALANADSRSPVISRDGGVIAYHSSSSNRLPAATSGATQIYTVRTGAVALDQTPPIVTGVVDRNPNADNWYNAPVTIDWQSTDPAPSSGTPTDPANTIANIEGTNEYTSDTSCDLANNCATGSVTLLIDTQSPEIAFTGNQGNYGVADTVSISCNITDTTSGVKDSSCSEIQNQPAYLYLNGGTVMASATDFADNNKSDQVSFTVTVLPNDINSLISQLASVPFDGVLQFQVDKIANATNQNQKDNFKQAFGKIADAAVLNGSLSQQDAALLKSLVNSL